MTKKLSFLSFIIILLSCIGESSHRPASNLAKPISYSDLVNVFVGTGGDHGQTDPAASVPFGMVKPGPDTDPIGHSGYNYNTDQILGFSHTRFSGVGCRGAGGNIRVLPILEKKIDNRPFKIDKTSEQASPGYYAVKFKNGINTELTASRSVAFHRYTFPASQNAGFKIDLTSAFNKHESLRYRVNDAGDILGFVKSENVCHEGKYGFYFAIKIDREVVIEDKGEGQVIVNFPTVKDDQVLLYCALSTISSDLALEQINREKEISFNQTRSNAQEQWNTVLKRFLVSGANQEHKTLFYTHLYHTMLSPFDIAEETGSFRGSDKEVYNQRDFRYFHGWSIWDTFRSKMPLFSIAYPARYGNMIQSLLHLYKQGKPQWATETEPFPTIRTEHSLILLLDAYQKQLISNSDLESVYPKLVKEAESNEMTSPDKILESCYDFWALAQIAKALEKPADEMSWHQMANSYREVWEDKFWHMDKNSDVMHGDGLYEGTLWQYRWAVTFDLEWIIQKIGGQHQFDSELSYFFDNDLFNIGNQPDIHVPYLYSSIGKSWKTQKLVNDLLTRPFSNYYGTHEKWEEPEIRKIFQNSPEGYISEMDDDAGTMSGWYVLSSLGLFPVNVGDPIYWISTPLFKNIKIEVGQGKTFEINAYNLTEENIYIQKASLNGEDIERNWLTYDEITSGGQLIYQMGSTPNHEWGSINPYVTKMSE